MSVVTDWRQVILTSKLSMPARCVAFALSCRMDSKGECYPAVPTIARDCGCSERTVQRAIAELRSSAYLWVTYRGRGPLKQGTNLYTARVPPWREVSLRHERVETWDNEPPIPF